LADGSELNLRQKDLLQVDGDGFADLEPPPELAEAAVEAKEKARQKLAAALAIISMTDDSTGSSDEAHDDSVAASGDMLGSGRPSRSITRPRSGSRSRAKSFESAEGASLDDEGGGGVSSSWICCDLCEKWRRLPAGVQAHEVLGGSGGGGKKKKKRGSSLSSKSSVAEWCCDMNTWDSYNRCWVEEEHTDHEEDEIAEGQEGASTDEDDGSALPVSLATRGKRKFSADKTQYMSVAQQRREGSRRRQGRTQELLGRRMGGGIEDDDGDGDDDDVGVPLRNFELVRPEDYEAVERLGADMVWALPAGRLVCCIEGKCYAVAHAGETVADLAHYFRCEVGPKTNIKILFLLWLLCFPKVCAWWC
jgi:hypothetical protein